MLCVFLIKTHITYYSNDIQYNRMFRLSLFIKIKKIFLIQFMKVAGKKIKKHTQMLCKIK